MAAARRVRLFPKPDFNRDILTAVSLFVSFFLFYVTFMLTAARVVHVLGEQNARIYTQVGTSVRSFFYKFNLIINFPEHHE